MSFLLALPSEFYTHFSSSMHTALPTNLIFLPLPLLIIFGDKYKLWGFSLSCFRPLISNPNIHLSALFFIQNINDFQVYLPIIKNLSKLIKLSELTDVPHSSKYVTGCNRTESDTCSVLWIVPGLFLFFKERQNVMGHRQLSSCGGALGRVTVTSINLQAEPNLNLQLQQRQLVVSRSRVLVRSSRRTRNAVG
jgi:hypothetical protein